MARKTYFDIAEDDFECARELLKFSTGTYNQVVICCQQAVEKYYKHLIVTYISKNACIPDVKHNLSLLEKYLGRTFKNLLSVSDDTDNLNHYYTKAICEGSGYTEIDKELAKECVKYATNIRKVVNDTIKEQKNKL